MDGLPWKRSSSQGTGRIHLLFDVDDHLSCVVAAFWKLHDIVHLRRVEQATDNTQSVQCGRIRGDISYVPHMVARVGWRAPTQAQVGAALLGSVDLHEVHRTKASRALPALTAGQK